MQVRLMIVRALNDELMLAMIVRHWRLVNRSVLCWEMGGKID